MGKPGAALRKQVNFVWGNMHSMRQNRLCAQHACIGKTLHNALAIFGKRIFLINNSFRRVNMKTNPIIIFSQAFFKRLLTNRQTGV